MCLIVYSTCVQHGQKDVHFSECFSRNGLGDCIGEGNGIEFYVKDTGSARKGGDRDRAGSPVPVTFAHGAELNSSPSSHMQYTVKRDVSTHF